MCNPVLKAERGALMWTLLGPWEQSEAGGFQAPERGKFPGSPKPLLPARGVWATGEGWGLGSGRPQRLPCQHAPGLTPVRPSQPLMPTGGLSCCWCHAGLLPEGSCSDEKALQPGWVSAEGKQGDLGTGTRLTSGGGPSPKPRGHLFHPRASHLSHTPCLPGVL